MPRVRWLAPKPRWPLSQPDHQTVSTLGRPPRLPKDRVMCMSNAMRIVDNAPDLLELEDCPSLLAGILGVATFLGAALVVTSLAAEQWILLCIGLLVGLSSYSAITRVVQRVSVRLDRTRGIIEIERHGLRGMRRDQFPLVTLRAACVETETGPGNRRLGRVQLIWKNRAPESISEYFASDPRIDDSAAAINAWLAARGSSL